MSSWTAEDARGVVALELATGEIHTFHAKAVLFATGGFGRMFRITSNAYANTGDGPAVLARRGVPLQDMEFFQFHPTGIKGMGILITEGVRGEGGILRNRKGERFMERYAPGLLDLAPRDMISRAILTELASGNGMRGDGRIDDWVLLDATKLGREVLEKKLPDITGFSRTYLGIDPVDTPIPIQPTAHYAMGGIPTDIEGRVIADEAGDLYEGLYAAGECACVSVHGANRLGTNSLVDLVVFGRRAGQHLAGFVKGGRLRPSAQGRRGAGKERSGAGDGRQGAARQPREGRDGNRDDGESGDFPQREGPVRRGGKDEGAAGAVDRGARPGQEQAVQHGSPRHPGAGKPRGPRVPDHRRGSGAHGKPRRPRTGRLPGAQRRFVAPAQPCVAQKWGDSHRVTSRGRLTVGAQAACLLREDGMKIVLRIRRFDPQTDREPHDEDYPVEAEPTERILDALIRVKDEQDGSLSFRRSCGHGVCGSDAMIIAGAERLACKTLVRDVAQEDGALIPIQPLRFLPVQRDLMVDQAVFFQKFKLVKPFLINGEPVKEKERIQSQAERAVVRRRDELHPLRRVLLILPRAGEKHLLRGPGGARAGCEIHLRQQGPRAPREDVGAGRSRRGLGLRESLQLHAGVPSRDQDHEEHQRDKEAPREGQGRKRMKLHEFQAKGFLREYGIPVPEGRPASTPQEAKAIAASIGCPVMVKAQVLVGGRGKAGGVKMAKTPEEAEARARDILGMRIKGIEVQRVLVAAAVDIAAEFYMSLAVDRSGKAVQCIASASGGMDIEEIAATQPDRIVRFALDPEKGPVREAHYAKLATEFKGDGLSDQAWTFLQGMYRLFSEKDCSLVEINPCAKTPQGKLHCGGRQGHFRRQRAVPSPGAGEPSQPRGVRGG